MFEIDGSTMHASPIPARRPSARAAATRCAQRVVVGELERVVEAGLVVAGVVQRARRRAVRHRGGRDQVAARELGRIEPEAAGGDRHRPLEPEVELRPAEATVEAGRDRVREHDAVPHGDVRDGVRARERAVHAVERRRLGCPDVRADVLDRVVAEREQLAVGVKPASTSVVRPGRRGARGEVLEPVLDPGHRHAEAPRGEPDQHDVREHGRLDPERAAGVGRRQQPQPVALEPERGGGDAVQRERALEVRPRRQPAGGRVPVGDDGVALDRRAGEAREAEGLAQDELGPAIAPSTSP